MNLSFSRLLRYVWLLGLLLVAAAPVFAQEGERAVTDDEVNAIAKEVYCPVCESTPLDVCETQACADWRDLIRTKLATGATRQEVFDYFAEQYGDRVLARPPARGLNLLLWIWPVVALLGGAAIFGRFMMTMRRAAVEKGEQKTMSASPPAAPPANPYVSRIEEELKRNSGQ